MSDDMASKLQQLKDMLNNDDMKDKLKSVMSIMPNMQNSEPSNDNSQQSGTFGLFQNDAMISKFLKIMDKRSKLSDPRINLLIAMKPYLNEKRQGRIDNYSKILNFTQLASILNDEDL